METLLKLLIEIHDMKIIQVNYGHYVSTGSFIAYDIDGNEYFANNSIVEINKNLYDALSQKHFFWVLVKEEIWTGKYTGKKNVINTISETKEGCQQFKSNKLCKLLLKEKMREVYELQLKDIDNKLKDISNKIENTEKYIYEEPNSETSLNESLFDKFYNLLQKELQELNYITPFNC